MKTIVTWIRECDETLFERMFAAYPDIQLRNARTVPPGSDAWAEAPAALLLTGGSDISAEFLRQPLSEADLAHIQEPDPARDAWEFAATRRALARRLPLLAICRGLQVLNVALGGTLHLDIPGHSAPEQKSANVQPLRYIADAALPIPASVRFAHVNSSHHQALDRLGAGLSVEARHAADGIVEQARLIDHPFALGVQYHPERDFLYRPLFDAFVAAFGLPPASPHPQKNE